MYKILRNSKPGDIALLPLGIVKLTSGSPWTRTSISSSSWSLTTLLISSLMEATYSSSEILKRTNSHGTVNTAVAVISHMALSEEKPQIDSLLSLVFTADSPKFNGLWEGSNCGGWEDWKIELLLLSIQSSTNVCSTSVV